VPAGSADRNRSEVVTVQTPRGAVDVMHQESRGLRKRSGWHRSWLARGVGKPGWAQATTPREAIGRAMLLPAGKAPGWLEVAATEAEQKLDLPEPVPRDEPGESDATDAER
jgi:hypothetical protein